VDAIVVVDLVLQAGVEAADGLWLREATSLVMFVIVIGAKAVAV
jgi:hypothetical protein